MRCGFDRLAERVSAVISQDRLSSHCLRLPRGDEPPKIRQPGTVTHTRRYKRLEASVSSCRESNRARRRASCQRVGHDAGRGST